MFLGWIRGVSRNLLVVKTRGLGSAESKGRALVGSGSKASTSRRHRLNICTHVLPPLVTTLSEIPVEFLNAGLGHMLELRE